MRSWNTCYWTCRSSVLIFFQRCPMPRGRRSPCWWPRCPAACCCRRMSWSCSWYTCPGKDPCHRASWWDPLACHTCPSSSDCSACSCRQWPACESCFHSNSYWKRRWHNRYGNKSPLLLLARQYCHNPHSVARPHNTGTRPSGWWFASGSHKSSRYTAPDRGRCAHSWLFCPYHLDLSRLSLYVADSWNLFSRVSTDRTEVRNPPPFPL